MIADFKVIVNGFYSKDASELRRESFNLRTARVTDVSFPDTRVRFPQAPCVTHSWVKPYKLKSNASVSLMHKTITYSLLRRSKRMVLKTLFLNFPVSRNRKRTKTDRFLTQSSHTTSHRAATIRVLTRWAQTTHLKLRDVQINRQEQLLVQHFQKEQALLSIETLTTPLN